MGMKLSIMVLILSGLLIGFGDFNGSSALDSIVIDRQSELHTASSDDTALLAPIGFNNTNLVLTTKYTNLGTIKNNTNQALNLRFYMDPNITAAKMTFYTMTMRMINSKGETLKTLSFIGTGVLDPDPLWSGVTSIDAGATHTIQGKLTILNREGFVASVLYGFEGVGTGTNALTINLQDTATNPRRQTYTAK